MPDESAALGREYDLMFGGPSKKEAAKLARAWGVRKVRVYRRRQPISQ